MFEKSLKAVQTQTWTAFSIFIVMVGTEGLEPSRAQCSTDFKSVASTSSATIPDKMEVPVGVEPTITELQSVALATWLRNHFVNPVHTTILMGWGQQEILKVFPISGNF